MKERLRCYKYGWNNSLHPFTVWPEGAPRHSPTLPERKQFNEGRKNKLLGHPVRYKHGFWHYMNTRATEQAITSRNSERNWKILCNFLHQPSASTSITSATSPPPFPLKFGVQKAKSNVLSPTLFITSTTDTPPPWTPHISVESLALFTASQTLPGENNDDLYQHTWLHAGTRMRLVKQLRRKTKHICTRMLQVQGIHNKELRFVTQRTQKHNTQAQM